MKEPLLGQYAHAVQELQRALVEEAERTSDKTMASTARLAAKLLQLVANLLVGIPTAVSLLQSIVDEQRQRDASALLESLEATNTGKIVYNPWGDITLYRTMSGDWESPTHGTYKAGSDYALEFERLLNQSSASAMNIRGNGF